MQQTYETIYILQPELTEEEVDANVATFEEILKERKADHHKTEKWGKKRLAYRVRKHWEGFYILMEYDAEASTVDELERRLRIHDNVIKWMSVRKDPRAAAEEERRAARMAKAQAQRAEGAPQGDQDKGGKPQEGGDKRPAAASGSGGGGAAASGAAAPAAEAGEAKEAGKEAAEAAKKDDATVEKAPAGESAATTEEKSS